MPIILLNWLIEWSLKLLDNYLDPSNRVFVKMLMSSVLIEYGGWLLAVFEQLHNLYTIHASCIHVITSRHYNFIYSLEVKLYFGHVSHFKATKHHHKCCLLRNSCTNTWLSAWVSLLNGTWNARFSFNLYITLPSYNQLQIEYNKLRNIN